MRPLHLVAPLLLLAGAALAAAEPVRLGFNYPETGPYAVQGLDQRRAAEMAVEEVNAAGGILGRPVELVARDSQSKPDVSAINARELIDRQGASMLFGGVSSAVAVAVGRVAQERGVPFFATLSYSTETTCEQGHRFTFRECYDSYAAAQVLGGLLRERFAGKRYLYVTADYTWGHSTEASLRQATGTADRAVHKGLRTRFPGAGEAEFRRAMALAKQLRPDVLVLVLFGKDMEVAIRQATLLGLKAETQIVVPNLTLGAAEGAGPKVMEGVIGALPWSWNLAYEKRWAAGIAFVERFAARHQRYPCTAGASAYVIVHQFKAAAERAGSLAGAAVVKALEGQAYTGVKDAQVWRVFDHQSLQSVFAVRCRPQAEVLKDRFRLDYFQTLAELPGDRAFIGETEWAARRAAAKPPLPGRLEALAGE